MTTTDRSGVSPDAPTETLPVVEIGEAAPAERSETDSTRVHRVVRVLGGIRGRVVLSYVLLVAGALLVSLLLVRATLLSRSETRVEAALVQEVEEVRRFAEGIDPTTGEQFGTDAAAIFDAFLATMVPDANEVVLTIVDGEPYKETLGAPTALASDRALVRRWADLEEPLRLDVGSGPDEARTLAVPLLDEGGDGVGTVVVAIFPHEQLVEIDRVVRTIGLIGLVVLTIAAGVAFGVARRVLRPVEQLGDTARRVSDNDLSARFDVDSDDELAELGSAFNDMLDRLEAGFVSQREVLDDVAHELRTPITIVQGHLEVLEMTPDADSRTETVALCLDELERMGRYVNELLQVASANRPDFLSVELVDVGELAEGLLARVEALAPRRWSLLGAPAPATVLIEADPDRLTQAVVNLAGNAVQHTNPGDPIELAVDSTDSTVRLSVIDHGPGVAPDVRDQLFTRFSRAAGSRSHRPDGTGLGLAIVSAIAEAHDGSIDVVDTPGGGATFGLTVARRNPFPEEVERR